MAGIVPGSSQNPGESRVPPPVLSSMTIDSPTPTRPPARQGLFGGLRSSNQPRAGQTRPPRPEYTSLNTDRLNDAVELIKARKGRCCWSPADGDQRGRRPDPGGWGGRGGGGGGGGGGGAAVPTSSCSTT